jgi:hypothetical protein
MIRWPDLDIPPINLWSAPRRHCEYCFDEFAVVNPVYVGGDGDHFTRCTGCGNITSILMPKRDVSRFDSTTEYEEDFYRDYYDV